MIQRPSPRRSGGSPSRSALLMLLALVVVLALAYLFSRPARPATVAAGQSPTAPPAAAAATRPAAGAALASVSPPAAPSRTPPARATFTAPAAAATATRNRVLTATPTRKPTRPPSATPTASSPLPAAPLSGLPTIRYDRLPKEARTTITLILQGGPFPYSQDGVVFQNRERVLPRKASGYYHEYTVITPGSSDRGARRIITGEGGEFYYTDDHYASFRQVTP